ncbi:MAG TPA: pitrilysin family protein [Xanthobacteraceae bacterium]|nr:pitrilysin family protein [Xanthobacteraceae bacterium]
MRFFQVRVPRMANLAALTAALLLSLTSLAQATKIERVVSPGGIEVWLVQDKTVPLIAMDFAFRGGAAQDPADRAGVANMVSGLLDEGAGELDSKAFHERLEEKAIQLGFNAGRDHFRGWLRTLVENRDQAVELLRLALTTPRFDPEEVERVRAQVIARLTRESTSPNDISGKRWWSTAFPGHPYGRPVSGTLESVPGITVADLKDYTRRVFAKDRLKIAVVGDIDAASTGALVDRVFGSLPAKAELAPVDAAHLEGLGRRIVVDLDVPQAVVTFGGPGIARKDPDFMAAYIVNHILGGGAFSSRLYREVREKRGLAYSVHSQLVWLDHAAMLMGGTGTRAERTGETIEVIEQEIGRLAQTGPTDEELAQAKSYLKGSYALGFDTSAKIAGQLVQIQLDDLGIDYIDRRSAMIDAVTIADVRRVAKRLLDGGLLVTVVGRPQGVTTKSQGG